MKKGKKPAPAHTLVPNVENGAVETAVAIPAGQGIKL